MKNLIFYILIILISSPLYASSKAIPISYSFYISSEIPKDKIWAEKNCKLIKEAVSFKIPSLENRKVVCNYVSLEKLPLNKNNQWAISIWEDFGGDYHVHSSNESVKGEWKIDTRKELWRSKLVTLIWNIIDFAESEIDLKKIFLVTGVEAGSAKVEITNDQFIDKQTKKKLSFEEAYKLYFEEGPKQKNYIMAALELSLILGGGIKWYYGNLSFNSQDFDFNGKKSSIRDANIFTYDRVRFDNNDAVINKKHLNAGLGYCLSARINGFSKYECLLTAIAASSIWEYFVEYKEVVSINDQIMTPMGGFILGEAAYQIGSKFVEQYKSPLLKFTAKVFGGDTALANWIKTFIPKSKTDIRQYGFDPDAFNYFDAGILYYQKSSDTAAHQSSGKMWNVESELLEIPLGSGKAIKIYDPNMVLLKAQGTLGKNVVDYFSLAANIGYKGLYAQNMSRNAAGDLYGVNMLIIPSSGIDIDMEKNLTTNQARDYNDMIINIKMMGALMRFEIVAKDLKFRVDVEGYGDFAMVQAAALKTYSKTNDISGMPSVIREQGYYYARGFSGIIGGSVSYSKLESGVRLSQDTFSNIKSRQRDMETVTFNPDITDTRQREEFFVRLRSNKNLNFKCAVESIRRTGQIEDYEYSYPKRELKKSCGLSYSFW